MNENIRDTRSILVLDAGELAKLKDALPDGDPLLAKLAVHDDLFPATDESLAEWVRHGRTVREIYNRRRKELGDALMKDCPFCPGDVCEMEPATRAEAKKIMKAGGLIRISYAHLQPMSESVMISYCAPKDSGVIFYGQISLPAARKRLRIVRRENQE